MAPKNKAVRILNTPSPAQGGIGLKPCSCYPDSMAPSPSEKLHAVLSGQATLDQVDQAHWQAREVNVSAVLAQPTVSGTPLLVDWLERQLRRSDGDLFKSQESRGRQQAIFWKLVDTGFDVRTPWADLAGTPRDLLDVVLESADLALLTQLEKRLGKRMAAQDLERRHTVTPLGADAPKEPYLHALVRRGKSGRAAVKWLLKRGVDPNQPDATGRNALFYASTAEQVQELFKGGMDPLLGDADGKTPVEHWLDNNNLDFALAAFSHTDDRMPAALRQAIALHAIGKSEFLSPGLRSVLVSLKPVLEQPMAMGDGTSVTLVDWAQRCFLQTGRASLSETAIWLLKNTPADPKGYQGPLTARQKLQLALLTCDTPTPPASGIKGFPSPQALFRQCVELESELADNAFARLSSFVSDFGCAIMEQALFDGSSRTSNALVRYGFLTKPYAEQVTKSVDGQPSLLSVAFEAQAVFLKLSRFGWSPQDPKARLAGNMGEWLRRGFPVPEDTLEPALKALAYSSIEFKEPAFSGDDLLSGKSVSNLAMSLPKAMGFWVNAVLQRTHDHGLNQVSDDTRNHAFQALKLANEPWPAWVSRFQQHRLDQALDSATCSTALARKPRM